MTYIRTQAFAAIASLLGAQGAVAKDETADVVICAVTRSFGR